MFEYNGKQYELKFNTERMKLIEATSKKSLMGEWSSSNGMFSLQTIEICFQFTLKEAGADTFVPQGEAIRICSEHMTEKGYATVALEIQEAMQVNMPFLFQAG